jgi:hypothetical protein
MENLSNINTFDSDISAYIAGEEHGYLRLGSYSSHKKAIKVLDMIQENYMNLDSVRMGYPTSKGCSSVFQMPSDEEAEDNS